MTSLRQAAVERYGFQPEEVQIIRDHRIALMMRDAQAYHALLAAQAKDKAKAVAARKEADAKRQPASAPRLGTGGATDGTSSKRTDASALRKQGKDFRLNDADRLDAVLAQI